MNIKQLLSFIFVAVPMAASAQGIEINEENFPDENFRKYLLVQDYGRDKILTDEEIEGITGIYLDNDYYVDGYDNGKNIRNLKGIEFFTALTFLACSYNQLTSLDVSNNKALQYLYCDGNQLTSLDVSNNTELEILSCMYNSLASLDVSKNTALKNLGCSGNQLTSLDVSKNTALTDLYVSSNLLTSLDVSNNPALVSFYCDDNQLTSLDVLNKPQLINMYCQNNQLTSLNVSGCTKMTHLFCNNNKLTFLDLSSNSSVWLLYCHNNLLKGIAMDMFINSIIAKRIDIFMYNPGNDGNIFTHDQAAALWAKGSGALYNKRDDNGGETWMSYGGCDAPTTDIVSVGTEGLSTYCPAFDMDFSNAKEIEAYKVSVSGINLYFDKVTSVAAGEGVLLRSINGGAATEELPIKATEKNEGNEFVGVLEAKVLQEKEGNVTNFILSKKNGEIGFYKANKNPIAAWKAYLPVTNYNPAAEIKGFNLIFRDPTTGIEEIETLPSAEDDAIYTLSGVRVTNPTKGIYIRNGKKVVVK